MDLRYEYTHLGEDPSIIKTLESGGHPFAKKLKAAKKPLIVVGADALSRPDGAALLSSIQLLARASQSGVSDPNWKVLNILHKVASQVAALDIGYNPGVDKIRALSSCLKVLYLLGADECAITREDLPKDCFVVYQGTLRLNRFICELIFCFFRPSWRLWSLYSGCCSSWCCIHRKTSNLCKYRRSSSADLNGCYSSRLSKRGLENN